MFKNNLFSAINIAKVSNGITFQSYNKGFSKIQTTSAAYFSSARDTLELPKCDFTPQKYEGPSYDQCLQKRKAHLHPSITTNYSKPLFLHQGHMQWLWDVSGKRYLDLIAGIVTVSVGHCHPKVVEAKVRQSNTLWHCTNQYMHPSVHLFAEKLASKMPGDLKVCYFVNSGAEANDLAIILARLHTGMFEVLSFRNGYHGVSPLLMGVTAHSTWRHATPTGFGMVHVVNPDPYRGPWGGSHCRDSPVQTDRKCDCKPNECKACDQYIDQLEDSIRYSIPKAGLAAFIAESIQGVGGTTQYPKNYLKRAFEIVRAKGGVCISDEVQTGFTRTGTHYWGFEGHDVIPDIVTMAKGIGNGYPLAAVVTTPKIAASLTSAIHFNTFGGNAVAGAIGSAVLDVIEEDKLQENSHKLGTHFLQELEKLRDEFKVVGDVRGKGLMIGVELVKNKALRTPLPTEVMGKIMERFLDYNIIVGKGGFYGNVLRIKPPMCITKQDVDYTIKAMKKVFKEFDL